MLRAEVSGGHPERAQGNAGGAPRYSLRGGDARARGGGARSPTGADDGRRRHHDARVEDKLLRRRQSGHGARGSDAAAPRAAHAGVADARHRRERQAPVADDPDPDGVGGVGGTRPSPGQRGSVALPSRKNLQPTTIATRPNANDGVYEPVRSYTNPASAGPSAAPLRQPSPTTLMIVASAATPNASGTAFTIFLMIRRPPRPKTTSVTGTAQAGRPATNATSAAAWITRHTRIVVPTPK